MSINDAQGYNQAYDQDQGQTVSGVALENSVHFAQQGPEIKGPRASI